MYSRCCDSDCGCGHGDGAGAELKGLDNRLDVRVRGKEDLRVTPGVWFDHMRRG